MLDHVFNAQANRFPNIGNGFFSGLSLADAAGQARALGNPITAFTGV
jgi:hypothetical protein